MLRGISVIECEKIKEKYWNANDLLENILPIGIALADECIRCHGQEPNSAQRDKSSQLLLINTWYDA